MRLTTRGRYAVTAMLDLALHGGEEAPIPLAEISGRQGISLSYLEQLFVKLRRSSLVDSIRGPGGGYRLGRGSSEICVAEVIDAVDESVDATQCRGSGACLKGARCLTHDLWSDLSEQIYQFLSGISLADLVERRDVLAVALRQDELQAAASARCLPESGVTENEIARVP